MCGKMSFFTHPFLFAHSLPVCATVLPSMEQIQADIGRYRQVWAGMGRYGQAYVACITCICCDFIVLLNIG